MDRPIETIKEANQRLAQAKADLEETKAQLARGQLVERAAVEKFVKVLFERMRVELGLIGGRLSIRLVDVVHEAKSNSEASIDVDKTLTDEIFQAFAKIKIDTKEWLKSLEPSTPMKAKPKKARKK